MLSPLSCPLCLVSWLPYVSFNSFCFSFRNKRLEKYTGREVNISFHKADTQKQKGRLCWRVSHWPALFGVCGSYWTHSASKVSCHRLQKMCCINWPQASSQQPPISSFRFGGGFFFFFLKKNLQVLTYLLVRVKLIQTIDPKPVCCYPPIQLVLIAANVAIWLLLLPFTVVYRLLSVENAALTLRIYVIYFAVYLFFLAVGFLTFGLRLYFSVIFKVGMANIRNTMINRVICPPSPPSPFSLSGSFATD